MLLNLQEGNDFKILLLCGAVDTAGAVGAGVEALGALVPPIEGAVFGLTTDGPAVGFGGGKASSSCSRERPSN